MSESEDQSFIILSSSPKSFLESYKQNTSIDEAIDKCTTVKEGLDDLAANIHSQFLSLSSSSSLKSEEMIKVQNILEEYMELKDALQKSNVEMREHFTALKKWQDEVRTQKEIHAKQLNQFQETVAKLRNENLELQIELEHKTEHEKSIKEENREMTKMLSDKTLQIQNMAVQIEKLEKQHLDSVDIRLTNNENEEEKKNKKDIENEYVPILEYKRMVKDLEAKLSKTVAKNFELDAMEEKYSKEVKELKDSLLECNEKLKEAQFNINVLKSDDDKKTKHFRRYEKERDEMRNEISILKTKLKIYSKIEHENLQSITSKIMAFIFYGFYFIKNFLKKSLKFCFWLFVIAIVLIAVILINHFNEINKLREGRFQSQN